MQRITISYATPADPEAFDSHYLTKHVPLVMQVPHLSAFSWTKPRGLAGDPDLYLTAHLDFYDADHLKTALRSPELEAANDDAAALKTPMTVVVGEVVNVPLAGA
ncbi:EthD family reductase [Kribbella sp. NPDC004536]|uniref:EthD family reductase n=1 Tax=Kribbella sp. NPDC004536 TaxID=3364106 RepID=UPI0036C2254F